MIDFFTSTTLEMIPQDIEKDMYRVRQLKDPKNVLDLGANIGMWALPLARKYPECQIYCVEAAPYNCANMMVNARENGCSNIHTIECALAGERAKKMFYQHPLNSGGLSIRNPVALPSIEIETDTLDNLMEHIGVESYDFVKVDLEGSEYETLQAFTQWHRIKRMGIELHGYQDERVSTEEEMEALIRLIGSKIGMENLCAVSYRKSYVYGEIVPWGIVQAREEDEAKGN